MVRQDVTQNVNMAVDLGGIAMKNPVNTASGTFGTGEEFEPFFDVSLLGAVTTKGCSADGWDGNEAPRMAKVTSGVLNSVGLQNPGVEAFCRERGEYLAGLREKETQVICQVAGHTVAEYADAARLFTEHATFASALELNISCPNIAQGGAAFGSDPKAAAEVVRAVRPLTKLPLVVKMAPGNVAEIARALEDAGADALALINTIPAMAIDVHTRTSKLARPTAGLSGPAIHPIAVRMVWECARATKLPICGIGGIASAEDAAEMILAGATAVSIGTANLVDPAAAPRILEGLAAWAEEQKVDDINDLIGAFEW